MKVIAASGRWLAAILALLGCAAPVVNTPRQAPTSALMANARVIEGSGRPAFTGAVRIDDDTIIALGDLDALPGEMVVVASIRYHGAAKR